MAQDEAVVSLYGYEIGRLSRVKVGSHNLIDFRFSESAIERWGLESTVLGLGLPIRKGIVPAERAASFFGGLLPEDVALDTLAKSIGVRKTDLFGIISRNGRGNLVGAVEIDPAGEPRRIENYTVLSDEALLKHLANPEDSLTDINGGTSLPGMRSKITLRKDLLGPETGWSYPTGGSPSTHILKPAKVGTSTDIALDRERYSLDVAREVGLLDYATEMLELGDYRALIIERYDRFVEGYGSNPVRLHQEDFQQALGLDWREPNQRFQKYNPRGVSLLHIAKRLAAKEGDESLASVESSTARLLSYATFNTVIGNTDAHAKNYSVLHDENDGVQLSPLYDVTPLAFKDISPKTDLALYINGKSQIFEVDTSDLVAEGERWGLTKEVAEFMVHDTIAKTVDALDVVDPSGVGELAANISESSERFGVKSKPVVVPLGVELRQKAPAGTCGHWMIRARRACSLPSGHNGQHR